MTFKNKLEKLKACPDAIEWVGDKTIQEAWEQCDRADWMLWGICMLELGTRKDRIHVICDCAETTLKYIPKRENRPKEAIKAARRYADEHTEENLKKLNAAGAAAGDAALKDMADLIRKNFKWEVKDE